VIRRTLARSTFATLVTAMIVAGSQPAAAKDASGTTVVDAFTCGHAQLSRALRAVGSEQQVAGIRQIGFTAAGDSNNAYQGYRTRLIDAPERDGELRVNGAFDFATQRFAQRNEQTLRGGLLLRFSVIATGGEVVNMRLEERTYAKSKQPSPELAQAQAYDFPARFLPPLLLLRARENLPSVRCETDADGARTLAFNWDARTRYRLRLDDSGRTIELQALQPDLLDGDTLVRFVYAGDQQVSGLHFPRTVSVTRRTSTFFAMSLRDVTVNTPLADTHFRVPDGFTELKDPPGLTSAALAEHVWEVRGAGGGTYRTQVFEVGDHLVLFDAPLQAAVTRQIAAHIHEKISKKSIRYVVLSHFHGDHSGGLATYTDLGATVLATPSDADVVRRILAARSHLQPPVTASATPSANDGAKIEVVDKTLVLRDSENQPRLEIRRIQGSPHVADILVIHHPESGVLAQADLYSSLTPFNETYAFFADWVQRSGLRSKTLAGVHHDPIPIEQFLSLARRFDPAAPPAPGDAGHGDQSH
jgi:glyoxylase-like metal-dependent hydrolase (beta-lactamase superfamily II)